MNAALCDAGWRALHRSAVRPYHHAGRFARHFAAGKLARDPVFRALAEGGLLPPTPGAALRVLDLGCGQGLLASLLRALQSAGRLPAPGWLYTGIELMPRDVARAEVAAGAVGAAARFVCADLREATLPAADLVVVLDVLHYFDHAAQQALLARVRAALAPRGRLLLRVGDAASRRGFAVSQWVDRSVTRLRGHRVPPTWGRPVAEWQGLLAGLGFAVRAVPMSRGTPFANVLLVADLHEGRVPGVSPRP